MIWRMLVADGTARGVRPAGSQLHAVKRRRVERHERDLGSVEGVLSGGAAGEGDLGLARYELWVELNLVSSCYWLFSGHLRKIHDP